MSIYYILEWPLLDIMHSFDNHNEYYVNFINHRTLIHRQLFVEFVALFLLLNYLRFSESTNQQSGFWKSHAVSNKTTQQITRKVVVWMVHNGRQFSYCPLLLPQVVSLLTLTHSVQRIEPCEVWDPQHVWACWRHSASGGTSHVHIDHSK